jgi:Transposase, Mutator family
MIVGSAKSSTKGVTAMAETKRMTTEQVVGYLLEGEGLDFLRESLTRVVQQLMAAEVSELIGAGHGERTGERLTHRNGYRARAWPTRAGELEPAIPKIRRGSYFPSFLELRKRSEQALVSVVQEAYVAGVSTRKVDQVVESLGLRISKSEVSRICAGLDEQVNAFRKQPLAATRICGWTRRWRRCATRAASCASVWCSPTVYTSSATARWSRSTSAKPRRKRFGAASSARWSSAA